MDAWKCLGTDIASRTRTGASCSDPACCAAEARGWDGYKWGGRPSKSTFDFIYLFLSWLPTLHIRFSTIKCHLKTGGNFFLYFVSSLESGFIRLFWSDARPKWCKFELKWSHFQSQVWRPKVVPKTFSDTYHTRFLCDLWNILYENVVFPMLQGRYTGSN